MATQSGQVWVWSPVNDKAAGFRHPGDLPVDEEALAKACFVENVRGPKMPANLRQAQMLDKKGRTVLIAEEGTTREVPSNLVLSWYEGLLLLQELQEKQDRPKWWNTEMGVLEKERSKFKDGQLAASLYLERRLLNTAVTGKSFVDGAGDKWEYRRDRLEQAGADDGEIPDGSGFWRIRGIVGYLPPWEAFCHEKCGFYQDFYQVQWAHPYSEIDYSMVENGCADIKGATWEPDECLPACMDTLRIHAKKEWIKKRREQESAMAEKARTKRRAEDEALAAQKRPQGQPPLKRLLSEDEMSVKRAPASRKATKRDGNPLHHDVFLSECGHDFAPPSADKIGEIRSGWPKSAEEYPKGYAVASPPGFCAASCDCMDDQRPQRSWETTKNWIEEPSRTSSVKSAVEEFGAQTRFVRRRGQVSNLCYFEALSPNTQDLPHANAAVKLAAGVSGSIVTALKKIPLHSLKAESHPVRIPARAFVKESADYAPLRCTGTLTDGGAFPAWLRLFPDDGRLYTEDAPDTVAEMSLSLEFRYAEGVVVPATIGITPERLGGPTAPWVAATARIVTRFQDVNATPLHSSARAIIKEHLGDVYDFQRGAPKDKTLGEWLSAMSKLLRMLRSTAVANINITSLHRAPAAR